MSQISEGLLFGMGNPLLDMQASVGKEFLDKWGLKPDDAILAEKKHVPLFEELEQNKDVEYVPGGATQNALRVAQWILKKPNIATFMGCIGNDKFGQKLEQKAREAGVNVAYQKNETEKTGTCGVLIYDQYRSLCADLAAANCFTIDHLANPKHKELVEKAQYYYIAGFFLTVCPAAIQQVAQHAHENNKTFMMNLSAGFLTHFFKEPMMEALPYVDILFGNETEAAEFAKEHDLGTDDVPTIAKKLSELPKKNASRPRMVVITQGPQPVVVAHQGKLTEYPVVQLSKSQMVDTNGAGDSFVGGFLSQLIQGKPLEECIRCGNWAAHLIIQRSGCTFPASCDYKPEL